MKLSKKPKSIILIVIGICIGSSLQFLIKNIQLVIVKPEIGIIETANLLVTAILGYYIATTLQKRQGASRVEKDWLISEVQKIRTGINNIETILEKNQIPLGEITSIFKSLSSTLYELIKLSEECKYSETDGLEKIRTKIVSIKRLVTNARTVNDNFILNPVQKSEALIKCRTIKISIFKEIVQINRSNIWFKQ